MKHESCHKDENESITEAFDKCLNLYNELIDNAMKKEVPGTFAYKILSMLS